jgi:hypothetical protein
MKTESKLESYLSTLDKSLGPIQVSERAEIVTEIKSHVLEAQQRDPSQSLDSVLAALGEPEQVASRYLLERGLKPVKPAKRSIIKWLVIGFLGTFALILTFIVVLIFKFSPLIQVDDSKEHVSLLGGLIEVNGKNGDVRIGQSKFSDHGESHFRGSKIVKPEEVSEIFIPFTNAKFTLENSDDQSFQWDCKAEGPVTEPADSPTPENKVLKIDLQNTLAAKCNFKIPAKMAVKITGNNLKMNVQRPHYHLDLDAQNGKVELSPDTEKKYHFNIKVKNGKLDTFDSTNEVGALQISISLMNGVVGKD